MLTRMLVLCSRFVPQYEDGLILRQELVYCFNCFSVAAETVFGEIMLRRIAAVSMSLRVKVSNICCVCCLLRAIYIF